MRRAFTAPGLFVLVVLSAQTWAPSSAAAIRQFSFDPADAETRAAAGPVTFVVRQSLLGSRVLQMRSTVARATADLGPADAGALGRSGVASALGPGAPERTVYRITAADDGPALVAALCPGAARAWLALTPVRQGENVQAVVIGDDAKSGGARRCRTLDFTYHGEWRLPPGAAPPPEPNEPPDFPN